MASPRRAKARRDLSMPDLSPADREAVDRSIARSKPTVAVPSRVAGDRMPEVTPRFKGAK